MFFVSLMSPALAQYPPVADTALSSSHGFIDPGLRVLCIRTPDTTEPSPTCPTLKLNGFTYWAYSYNDNRVNLAIVAYDPSGAIAKKWAMKGARYIMKINVNEAKGTVDFVGQAEKTITMSWRELMTATQPGALSVANIKASAVDCLLDTGCGAITSHPNVSNIVFPSGVSGTGSLQTRTVAGRTGAPLAGKTVYQYRVDMSHATSDGESSCVTDVSIDLGPVLQKQYDGSGAINDAFVVSQGGIGTVGILSAIKTGNVATFTFERPVCAGPSGSPGLSSMFFGVAADKAPKSVTAIVGWPGLLGIKVGARAPAY